MKSGLIKGNALLLLTAIIWGSAFVFQKVASESMSALSFNAIRFSLGAVALLPLMLLPQRFFDPTIDEHLDLENRFDGRISSLLAGSVAGGFMFIAIWLQQFGLSYTTSGKAGFLTSIYIIIVPLIGLFFKQYCRINVWLGLFIVLIGIYTLTLGNSNDVELSFNLGDILMIISTFGWAGQIFWLSVVAKRGNVLKIAIIQMTVVAIISWIAVFVEKLFFSTDLPTLELIYKVRWQIFYTGVISASIAFTLQIIAQRYITALNAALVMSLESIFAMFSGVIFLNEILSNIVIFGCVLIFIGITISQIPIRLYKKLLLR